jgi:hypothetical protein
MNAAKNGIIHEIGVMMLLTEIKLSSRGINTGDDNLAMKIATNHPTKPRNSRVIPRIVDSMADINRIAIAR